MFTEKQIYALKHMNHRWNIDEGATRSGKTYISYYKIPIRIKQLRKGNMIMIGKTMSTLSYNVLDPMRELYGEKYVSIIKKESSGINYCLIFGRKFRVVGADNKASVAKIQGAGLIYCYGDEVATWHKDVFTMLKSRLDSKDACFDGTTNPDAPNHWLKEFIDDGKKNGVDINNIRYVIDDNSYLDVEFREALKREYLGTIYYDRFILGRWVAAEGSIYTTFIRRKKKYIIDKLPNGEKGMIIIGVDFGGNKSGQAFNATLISSDFKRLYTIKDYWNDAVMSPQELESEFVKWVKELMDEYNYNIYAVYADSAEQLLKNGLQAALIKAKMNIKVNNSIKSEINGRIKFYSRLFGANAYKILSRCKHTISAFEGAVWRDTQGMKDERLDDGTSNIDTLDAQEYSTEKFMKQISKILDMEVKGNV